MGGSPLCCGQVLHHGGQRVPCGTSNPHRSQRTRAGGTTAHYAQGLAPFFLVSLVFPFWISEVVRTVGKLLFESDFNSIKILRFSLRSLW